jgi:hypothetical protein
MNNEIKITASVIAIGISFIAYIPYIIDMFRVKNKPHIYSWVSIFLITCVVGYLQLIGGAGIGALPTLLGVITYLVIIILCLRFGTKDIVPLDMVCLGLSIVGVLIYVGLRSRPELALVIVTFAELIGFIPTWRKTLNAPFSESLSSYYFLVVKLLLILVALEGYNFLTVANTVCWLVIMLGFISTTILGRRGRTHVTALTDERKSVDLHQGEL